MSRDDKTIVAGPELLWQTDAYALMRLVRHHLQQEAPTPRAREDLRRAVGESCEGYERLMRARVRTGSLPQRGGEAEGAEAEERPTTIL